MRHSILPGIPMLLCVGLLMFLPLQDTAADDDTESGRGPRRPFRGKLKEEMVRRHPGLFDPEEAKKWVEEARKFKSEVDELGDQLSVLEEKLRGLFMEHREAESEEEKARIKADLDRTREALDEVELEIAAKRLEFSENSFKLALDRLVEARVEYRETLRRIEWRQMILEGRGRGGRRFHPPGGPPGPGEPEGPPPDER